MKIGFIGAGNMAEAMIKGILSAGIYSSSDVFVSDISQQRLEYISQEYQVQAFGDNGSVLEAADMVVLAVKPQSAAALLASISPIYPAVLPLVSIAAGVTVSRIAESLGDVPIMRAMPNTPSLVGAGACGIYVNKKARPYIDDVLALFGAIGEAVLLKRESDIDIVTALSGSGPAYYFLLIEEMINAAIALGLEPQTAKELTLQTAYGAAKLAIEAEKTGQSPEQLRRNVTSPGGTTEAALKVFNEDQFGAIVVLAMQRAKERSQELSNI